MGNVKLAAADSSTAGLAARLLFGDSSAGAGELTARGIGLEDVFVATTNNCLVGAIVTQVSPGRTGWLWSPVVHPTHAELDAEIARGLVQAAVGRLQSAGCRLVQALISPESERTELERCQFVWIADILRMERAVRGGERPEWAGADLEFVLCGASETEALRQVVERTYEQTMDCPALDTVRGAAEMLDGFRRAAPQVERWCLVRERSEWVGCVLGAYDPREKIYELQYLGVVPRARGRKLGGILCRRAVCDAQGLGGERVCLSVDVRNVPALRQYRGEGFVEMDRRSVWIRVLQPRDG